MLRHDSMPAGRRRGFTLVEILVVIGIMMILIATLFPVTSAIRRSQRIRRTQAAVQAIASGVEAYQNDYGLYPPAGFADEPLNRGNRSLVTLLNMRGGRGWPYVPTAFLASNGTIEGGLLRDEWEHPFVYFDVSVTEDPAFAGHNYTGNPGVKPAMGRDGFCNFPRFQIWSFGPDGKNNGGRSHGTEGADDIANFVLK